MPKFSIIIPVYNVAPYLRECLDSVLAQTFTDWEAICVDDGSTDESGVILDGYAARDSRFRVIHQKNVGVSAARNAALKTARGEWIGFLDADDSILPTWIDHFFELSRRFADVDVIMCNSKKVYSYGKMEVQHPELKGLVAYTGDAFTNVCKKTRDAVTALVWDKIFRKDLIASRHIRFLTGIPNGEDTFFAECCVAYAAKMVVDGDASGYLYRQRESSAVHTRSLARAYGALTLTLAKIEAAVKIKALIPSAISGSISLPFVGQGLSIGNQLKFCWYLASRSEYKHVIVPFVRQYGTSKSSKIMSLTVCGPRVIRFISLMVVNLIRKMV